MVRGNEDRMVLGKQVFQDRLKKALSRRSKVGIDRLLDHVNLLSSIGSSRSASSLIVCQLIKN